MKVILYTTLRPGAREPYKETSIIEDDGTDDGGRLIAKFGRYEEAKSVADNMGWVVTDDNN